MPSYSLYLFEPEVQNFHDCFSGMAQKELENALKSELNDSFGDGGIAYIFQGPNVQMSWSNEVSSLFESIAPARKQSAAGVILFKLNLEHNGVQTVRYFATTFGHGWTKLNDDFLTQDFGLRVAINSLSDEKVRQVYATNLSEAFRTSILSPSNRGISNFGHDTSIELISRLSGSIQNKTNDEGDFVEQIEGAKAAKISAANLKLHKVPEKAREAFDLYHAEHYKQTAFQFIDDFRPVSSKSKTKALFSFVTQMLQDNPQDLNLELINPEWEVEGLRSFRFLGKGIGKNYAQPELRLQNYVSLITENSFDLFTHKVVTEVIDTKFQRKLPISHCLIGTIEYEGKQYAIDQGHWYDLEANFKHSIDASFNELIIENDEDRPPIHKINPSQQSDGKKTPKMTGYERELDYNIKLAKYKKWICLDQIDWHPNPDNPHEKIELCDLLDIENKRLIHLKIGRGSSATFSHHFMQGYVSARNLKRGKIAIDRFFQSPSISTRLSDKELERTKTILSNFSAQEWEVVYYILDYPNKEGAHTIPFF